MAKTVLADEIDMFPSQRCDMREILFRYYFAPLFQFFNRLGQVDCIPGSDGRHNQMQADCTVHLVFKCSVPQFPMFARKELARQRVQGLAFIQSNKDATTKRFVLKIVQQERSPLQFSQLCERSGKSICRLYARNLHMRSDAETDP